MDYQSHQTYFAWQAFNEMDKEIRLEKTYGDGGGGYSTGSSLRHSNSLMKAT